MVWENRADHWKIELYTLKLYFMTGTLQPYLSSILYNIYILQWGHSMQISDEKTYKNRTVVIIALCSVCRKKDKKHLHIIY